MTRGAVRSIADAGDGCGLGRIARDIDTRSGVRDATDSHLPSPTVPPATVSVAIPTAWPRCLHKRTHT